MERKSQIRTLSALNIFVLFFTFQLAIKHMSKRVYSNPNRKVTLNKLTFVNRNRKGV